MTLKRLLDLILVLGTVVFWVPILFLVALLVKLHLGGRVIFRQRRVGQHGRLFTMVKFRTMHDARGADGELLPDDQRLPPFGRVLRSMSIDELPELWNVLLGDMSLVGPRPLLPEYLPLYSAEQARRHLVKPGITGWAQVNGRNALTWDEKFALDVWYVEQRSLWLDIRILLQTLMTVMRRAGVSQDGHATAEAFRGSVAQGSTGLHQCEEENV